MDCRSGKDRPRSGVPSNYFLFVIKFHPEKAQFEFGKGAAHNNRTIALGQESANYFVNQCRLSRQGIIGPPDRLIMNVCVRLN